MNNALIKVIEQLAYREKEKFIDEKLPILLDVFSESVEIDENA